MVPIKWFLYVSDIPDQDHILTKPHKGRGTKQCTRPHNHPCSAIEMRIDLAENKAIPIQKKDMPLYSKLILAAAPRRDELNNIAFKQLSPKKNTFSLN